MFGFGWVSSRTLWLKFKFSKVKVCMVILVVYNSTDGNVEEREVFWKDLDRVIGGVGKG